MNLYSNKQRWKIFLLAVAMVIVAITLWSTKHIADRIRVEEHERVQLWSQAILRRAELVRFTEELFSDLRSEESKRADMIAKAYKILSDPADQNDLTFVTDFIWSNTSVPILIYDQHGVLQLQANLPEGREKDKNYIDSLFLVMKKYEPISFPEVGWNVYHNDSYLFLELQKTLDDLIGSFISETVINSASVPVILTDSTRSVAVKIGSIDSLEIATPENLARRLRTMESQNQPIRIELPGAVTNYIYYEDSQVLKQLKYFPILQLTLIAVFLLVSYLIFSTFRRAEQNQVWVGMAKETAHQLGTPLSSLMAWSSLLETQGVDRTTLDELNKDVERLGTITDRFSKIGSTPELKEENVYQVVKEAMDYLSARVSSQVTFSIEATDKTRSAHINKPLFSWVLENLVKNAVDAMDGRGKLKAVIMKEGFGTAIEITDTGKGIAKNKFRTVFEPGFTTKKRGWGLGLSLAKRIIHNYHEGRIFVKSSEPGVATTFRIELRG